MKAKITDKIKIAAFLLNKEFGYTMKDIGEMFGVSQSTISNSIKDISLRIELNSLNDQSNQLKSVKEELISKGYQLTEDMYVIPEFKKEIQTNNDITHNEFIEQPNNTIDSNISTDSRIENFDPSINPLEEFLDKNDKIEIVNSVYNPINNQQDSEDKIDLGLDFNEWFGDMVE